MRFGVLYAVLAVLVAAGIGAFALLLMREAPPEAAAWSSWKPEGSALEKVQQIADQVPKAYLTADNDQVNFAIARGLVAQVDDRAIPVGAIVIESDAGAGAGGDDVAVYDAADSVGIALCGFGPACSIPGGDTSDARFALRRQAVELSLYALKYIGELDSVVVFMPPTPAGESRGMVFLRRADVRNELKLRLDETLPARTAQIVGETSPEENAAVARLTDPRLYAFAYEAAPDGNPIIVLSPPG